MAQGQLAGYPSKNLDPLARRIGPPLTIADGVSIPGDRDLLTQALVNLVENALCHTAPDATVTLVLEAGDDTSGPRLIVADNGPGIPADQRSKVLGRFHRLDGSRNTPGSGLGLSLVAAVADLHQATLTLEDNEPGLRVVIRF